MKTFIYNTTSTTPPVDVIVAINRRNTSFNLILTNINHNRNVSNYTVKLYTDSNKTALVKTITGISITNNTYLLEQLDRSTTYYIKFIANIDGTSYEFTTQPQGNITTDITINDISVNNIVAGPQKLQFYLSRRVRSVSNENILIRYIPDINGNGTFLETNQIIKRFYVVDSSMIELTGLFPQRNISGAYIRVEYFVSHTNDFNSSNEIQITPALLSAVKPGYFYPIAPKLTSGSPLPLNTTYTQAGNARITWVPNEFRINYPNENGTQVINSSSLPVYN